MRVRGKFFSGHWVGSGGFASLRRIALLLAGALALAAMNAPSARADCIETPPASNNFICAPPGTAGINDPVRNNATVTIEAGATVVDDGVVAIGLNNRNVIINNGTVLAGSVIGTTAIGVHNGSTIINNGIVDVVSDGNGLFADNNSAIVNNGNITGGDNVFAITVRNNTTVINAGSIALGGFGATGIDLNNDSINITNSGSITAGVFSIGINARNNNIITNSGSISLSHLSFGINVRDGNTVTNSGTITVGDFGAAGIQARDDSPMILNTGTIVAGAGSPGIVVRDDNVVMNNGTITVANDPFGISAAILARRGNTITNNGTIIAGDSNGSLLNAGIGVGLFSGNTFTNNGTVIAGAFGLSLANAPGGPANANTIINNGTLDGLIFLPSIIAPGASNFVTNAGLITITNPNTPFAPHTIDGTFTQTATGTLALRFSSNNALSNYDILEVNSNNAADKITLDGTIRAVIRGSGFQRTTTYLDVLTCVGCTPAIDGTFAQVVTSSPFSPRPRHTTSTRSTSHCGDGASTPCRASRPTSARSPPRWNAPIRQISAATRRGSTAAFSAPLRSASSTFSRAKAPPRYRPHR